LGHGFLASGSGGTGSLLGGIIGLEEGLDGREIGLSGSGGSGECLSVSIVFVVLADDESSVKCSLGSLLCGHLGAEECSGTSLDSDSSGSEVNLSISNTSLRGNSDHESSSGKSSVGVSQLSCIVITLGGIIGVVGICLGRCGSGPGSFNTSERGVSKTGCSVGSTLLCGSKDLDIILSILSEFLGLPS